MGETAGLTPACAWFLDDLAALRGASPHTVSNYRRDLIRYTDFLAARGLASWDEVRPEAVESYVAALAAGTNDKAPLAPSSVARNLSSLRSFHRWLVQENLTQNNPAAAVKPPKAAEKLPAALTSGQVSDLLEAAKGGDPVRALRDSALLEFLYGTGARVSEAAGVRVDDVDLTGEYPVARLFGKGNRERLVPLGSYAAEAIGNYLTRSRPALASRGRGNSYLFLNLRGAVLSRQSAWEVIQRAAQVAGLAGKVSPHTLRHSYATHLLEGGASIREVQELLGHASVTTTQIYTRLTPQSLQEVYRQSHPRAL